MGLELNRLLPRSYSVFMGQSAAHQRTVKDDYGPTVVAGV
jgi:hypothetical protein